jgi:hypothetical protein
VAEKKKVEILTSPIGTLGKFPKLKTPDEYKGKKTFKADLILSAEEAAPIISRINEMMPAARAAYAEALKEAKAKAAKAGKKLNLDEPKEHLPFYDVCDAEGVETGDIALKFKSSAEYEDKKTGQAKARFISFWSASGKHIDHKDKPDLWGGSRVRIAYSMSPFGNLAAGIGVSLRIEAVKVIQAVGKGDGGDAARYGFGDAEDGYEPEDSTRAGMEGDEGAASDDEDAPAF